MNMTPQVIRNLREKARSKKASAANNEEEEDFDEAQKDDGVSPRNPSVLKMVRSLSNPKFSTPGTSRKMGTPMQPRIVVDSAVKVAKVSTPLAVRPASLHESQKEREKRERREKELEETNQEEKKDGSIAAASPAKITITVNGNNNNNNNNDTAAADDDSDSSSGSSFKPGAMVKGRSPYRAVLASSAGMAEESLEDSYDSSAPQSGTVSPATSTGTSPVLSASMPSLPNVPVAKARRERPRGVRGIAGLKVQARRALSMGPTSQADPITKEFQLQLEQSEVRGVSDGRKKKKQLSTTERALKHVVPPIDVVMTIEMLFPEGKNGPPDHVALKQHFLREGRLTKDAASELIQRATLCLSRDKNLLQIKSPVTVVGDIHGQYFDLVAMLNSTGVPDGESEKKLLFLGDYVDRGYFGCEVVLYLFALKLNFPQHVFLTRGNHECREVTKMYNFHKECKYKYDLVMWEKFMIAFDSLPIAAVVSNRIGERFFCVHGGISPYVYSLEDVENCERFVDIGNDGALCDLVWSDPLYKPDDMAQEDYLECRWEYNSKRKISYTFGFGVLQPFLEENNLQSVVRAHEVKQEGHEELWYGFNKETRKYPPVITVFSAPNYCDMYKNKSSFINFAADDGFSYGTLSWSDHPFCLPDFKNAFVFAFPFLMSHLTGLIVGLLKEAKNHASEETKKKVDEQISKIQKWNTLSNQVREERMAIFLQLRALSEMDNPAEVFERVTEIDATFEMMSPVSKNDAVVKKRRNSSYF